MVVDVNRLRVNLGQVDDPTFDELRAEDLLDQVQKLVIPITGEPIPDSADPVIITALKRAYVNPTDASTVEAGPYSASYHLTGVYLTTMERAALQRALNQGNHFAGEMLPTPYTAAP